MVTATQAARKDYTGGFKTRKEYKAAKKKARGAEPTPSSTKTFTGTIQGKVYTGLTEQEILQNKLSSTSGAKVDTRATRERISRISATKKIETGQKLTSDELFSLASGGKRTVSTNRLGTFVVGDQERQAQIAREKIAFQQKKARQQQLARKIKESETPLEKFAGFITKKDIEISKRQLAREKRISSLSQRRTNQVNDFLFKVDKSKYLPKKFKKFLKTYTKFQAGTRDKLLTLSAKSFANTIAFGEQLSQSGTKAVFLGTALGANIANKQTKSFAKELVSPTQKKALKKVYTDRNTYLAAAIGAAFVSASKYPVKNVNKIPATKLKGVKAKTVLRDTKGNYAIVKSNGKVVKVPSKLKTNFKNAIKEGKTVRKTKVAKAKQTKLIKREVAKRTAKQTELRFEAGARKVIREGRVKAFKGDTSVSKIKSQLSRKFDDLRFKLGRKNKIKPSTDKQLRKIELRETNKLIDAFKKRSKAAKKAAKTRRENIKVKAKAKVKLEKTKTQRAVDRDFDIIERQLAKIKRGELKARVRSDAAARKLGFKNTKERSLFESLSESSKTSRTARFKLNRLERAITKRNLQAKQIKNQKISSSQKKLRNDLIDNALDRIGTGKLTVKRPRGRGTRKQYTKKQTIELTKQLEKAIKRPSKDIKVKSGKTQLVQLTKKKTIKKRKLTPTQAKSFVSSNTYSALKSSAFIDVQFQTPQGKVIPVSRLNTTPAPTLVIKSRLKDNKPVNRLISKLAPALDVKPKQKVKIKPEQGQKPTQKGKVIPKQSIKIRSKSAIKQVQKQQPKLQPKLKQKPKLRKPIRRTREKNTPKIPRIIKLPKFPDWKTPLKRGEVLLVNPRVKIKGKIKEIKLETTPNRTIRYIKNKVDRTTARSFELKIVGVAKGKDISAQNLTKFRRKLSKNKKVLRFVEKSKFAIDTLGEKQGLRISKLIKKKLVKRKVIKKKVKSKKGISKSKK